MKKHYSSLLFPLFPCLLITLLAGCSRDGFTIEGTLEGGAGHTLWLEEMAPEGPLFIDSIPVDSRGHFEYRYRAPYLSMYNLHASASNYVVTLPTNGEHLELTARWDDLPHSYAVTGSSGSELLWTLQQYTNDGIDVLRQLVDTSEYYARQLEEGRCTEAVVKAKRAETDSIYLDALAHQRDLIHRFIEENQGSLTTLIALYKTFSGQPLVNPRNPDDQRYYTLVLEGLQRSLPDNPHTQRFASTITHMRPAKKE